MRGKFVLGITFMLFLLSLSVLVQGARAVMLTTIDEGCGGTVGVGCVGNIQPLDDFWPNLTLPTIGFKHRFPIDYSGSSLGDDTPLSADEVSNPVGSQGKRILSLVIVKEKIIFGFMLP
jgi:hypothetical protein